MIYVEFAHRNTHICILQIDVIIADCLELLSINEMKFVLKMFLDNCVEMRRCSIEGDKCVKKLEVSIPPFSYHFMNEIIVSTLIFFFSFKDDRSALRVTLFKLYEEFKKVEKINRVFEGVLKRIYEDPVRVLQRVTQQKRENNLIPKSSKSNNEISTVTQKLLSIAEQTDSPCSSHSLQTSEYYTSKLIFRSNLVVKVSVFVSETPQESQPDLPSSSKVSSSLKIWHNSDDSSSAIKVTRDKTKLHFKGQKTCR